MPTPDAEVRIQELAMLLSQMAYVANSLSRQCDVLNSYLPTHDKSGVSMEGIKKASTRLAESGRDVVTITEQYLSTLAREHELECLIESLKGMPSQETH